MDDPREIYALTKRIENLETTRRELLANSYKLNLEKIEKIDAYDQRVNRLMVEHPALQEAWDSFLCLYRLGVSEDLATKALDDRQGCFLCWTGRRALIEDKRWRQAQRKVFS